MRPRRVPGLISFLRGTVNGNGLGTSFLRENPFGAPFVAKPLKRLHCLFAGANGQCDQP